MNAPVITSLLDTDLYKFTMLQAMLHRQPAAMGRYRFVCRNEPAFPLAELAPAVERELDALCTLTFKEDELAYLAGLRFMKSDFVDWLHLFRFQRRFIKVEARGTELSIEAEGPIIHVMGFEIPVLAIVNEVYFAELQRRKGIDPIPEGRARLNRKVQGLKKLERAPHRRFPFEVFDFGLRRRFSGAWQREVAQTLKGECPQYFRGISNVRLAKEINLTPIGTMAHEYLQMYQATGVRLALSQRAALEDWVQEYRGDLGIALTDVVGSDAFIKDFDLYFAKLFDGVRHDSGDPVIWGEKFIAHYRSLRIDPAIKRLVFSDGLNVDKAIKLYHHFGDRIQCGFGIGTNLSNDMGHEADGFQPLNIVMKMVECNGSPVAKLSDSPGKTLCEDREYVNYLAKVFEHPAFVG